MLACRPEAEPDAPRRHTPLDASESNHAHLRRLTRPWHHAVDAYYTRLDLSKRDDLATFLLAQARAVPPLERAVAASGALAALGEGGQRRRATALKADLAHLALALPRPACAPGLPTLLHGACALYVLEGATLGGRVLLRQVMASPDLHVRGAGRFLGQFDPSGWRVVLAMLNRLPSDAGARAALVAGAIQAFAMFLPNAHQPKGSGSAVSQSGSDLVQSAEA